MRIIFNPSLSSDSFWTPSQSKITHGFLIFLEKIRGSTWKEWLSSCLEKSLGSDTQPVIACSKLTTETLEQDVRFNNKDKFNNKDTRTIVVQAFCTNFTPCSSVSIANFEHVIADWIWVWRLKILKIWIQLECSFHVLGMFMAFFKDVANNLKKIEFCIYAFIASNKKRE